VGLQKVGLDGRAMVGGHHSAAAMVRPFLKEFSLK